MPRQVKLSTIRRRLVIDPIHKDNVIAKLTNIVMYDGKKTTAEKIIYSCFDHLKTITNEDPKAILDRALQHTQPLITVKPIRLAGTTYQVPVEIAQKKQISLALKYLVQASRKRSEKSMAIKLACELKDASNKKGNAIKIKEELHKRAEANRAFAHFRW